MSSTAPAIFGMGNPLLDISAHVPHEYLEKYGVSLNNAVLAEEKHLPMYAEMVEKFEVEYIAGGATQNSIRVAQWVAGKPGQTAFVGCVGEDEFGAKLEAAATAAGVHVEYLKDASAATGTCAVLIEGGERSLVANLGAANNYKEEHVHSPAVDALLSSASIAYISGFFLTVSPPTIQHVARTCLAAGKTMMMNLSAPFICAVFKDPLLAALPFVDILFGNESEAAALGEALGLEDTSVEAVARHVVAMPKEGDRPRTVIITQGSSGTLVATTDGVTVVPVTPLAKELLVDTNGAGDAFVGGFLASFADGKGVDEAVRVGHAAARIVIQHSGCTFPAEFPGVEAAESWVVGK